MSSGQPYGNNSNILAAKKTGLLVLNVPDVPDVHTRVQTDVIITKPGIFDSARSHAMVPLFTGMITLPCMCGMASWVLVPKNVRVKKSGPVRHFLI